MAVNSTNELGVSPERCFHVVDTTPPAGQTFYSPVEDLRDAERYRAVRAHFIAEHLGEFSAAEFDAQCDGFTQSED